MTVPIWYPFYVYFFSNDKSEPNRKGIFTLIFFVYLIYLAILIVKALTGATNKK